MRCHGNGSRSHLNYNYTQSMPRKDSSTTDHDNTDSSRNSTAMTKNENGMSNITTIHGIIMHDEWPRSRLSWDHHDEWPRSWLSQNHHDELPWSRLSRNHHDEWPRSWLYRDTMNDLDHEMTVPQPPPPPPPLPPPLPTRHDERRLQCGWLNEVLRLLSPLSRPRKNPLLFSTDSQGVF